MVSGKILSQATLIQSLILVLPFTVKISTLKFINVKVHILVAQQLCDLR